MAYGRLGHTIKTAPGILAPQAQQPATPRTQTVPDPSKTNISDLAGPQQGANAYSMSEQDLAAGRLDKMLQSDSPYITRARTRAAEVAQSRGLMNSSLAAGAGEAAAIDAAQPFALADSAALQRANEFNTNAKNTFGLQSNDISNTNARAQYQGILSNYQQTRDLGQQQSQFDQTYALDNRRLGESTRQFDVNQRLERDRLNASSTQAQGDRQLEASRTIAQLRDTANTSIRALESDPNMSADAKRNAINNILTATQDSIQQFIQSTGLDMPDSWPPLNLETPQKSPGGKKPPTIDPGQER